MLPAEELGEPEELSELKEPMLPVEEPVLPVEELIEWEGLSTPEGPALPKQGVSTLEEQSPCPAQPSRPRPRSAWLACHGFVAVLRR